MEVIASLLILTLIILSLIAIFKPSIAKQTSRGKAFAIYFVPALLISALIPAQQETSAQPARSTQDQFCDIIEESRSNYKSARNAGNSIKENEQKQAARENRKTASALLIPEGKLNLWTAEVTDISSYDGKITTTLKLDCKTTLINRSTPADSPLGQVLANINEGQSLSITGNLLPAKAESKDAFIELSITESGGMSEPEHPIHITHINNQELAGSDPLGGIKPELSDADCLKSLECWGERHWPNAEVACKQKIERLAQYEHEWTHGLLGSALSRRSWLDKDAGTLNFYGDAVKFKNGFGAWQNHRYKCGFNPQDNSVLAVAAEPGHF